MRVNCFVALVVSFVNMCAFITGLYIGGFNGVLEMDGFKDTFSEIFAGDAVDSSQSMSMNGSQSEQNNCSAGNGAASDTWVGVMVGSSNFGSFLGSLVAGWLADRFSRKYGLAISGAVMFVGIGILAGAFFVWMVVAGRVVTGIAVGIFYMVMPVYIAEMSPKESRGMLGSTIGPTFNLGVNIAYFYNIGFSKVAIGWRIAIGLIAFFAAILAVGMNFMPHTPRWLVKRGRDHEALRVLSRINHRSKSETVVDTLVELEDLRASTKTSSDGQMRFLLKELFQYKYRLLLSGCLFFFESTTGIFVYYYSTTIFCEVDIDPFVGTVIVGVVVLVASLVLTSFIDKLGRKALFLLCTFLITVAGLIIAVLIQLFDTSDAAVGYTIVVLICIYAFGYSCSWLTLPWVVNSEIFPVSIRGTAGGMATGLFWLLNFVVNLLTPIIIGSPLQLHGFFYILVGCNLLAFVVVLFGLPETKGVSLEDMDRLFSEGLWKRFIGTFKCSFGSSASHIVEMDLTADDYKYSSKKHEDFEYSVSMKPAANKAKEMEIEAEYELDEYKIPD